MYRVLVALRARTVDDARHACEAGSYLRLIDSCTTQLKAQGPSRTCNESKGEEEDTAAFGMRIAHSGCAAICLPCSSLAPSLGLPPPHSEARYPLNPREREFLMVVNTELFLSRVSMKMVVNKELSL